ncbi:S53 family peptidase [Ectobacillus ponti]|uniref:Protease pro-enzyme activation domain-containing protein n=1 Tax=Ectobacillus ponti TaxID=2961894 RepID=A0AA41X729_9BACI|nr:protease pro-enzyme activation domain-containing protein [Ectobacillus ponti]MCP8970131.1 protease pro-enzyme activation domain-containing protein [Ectobacillus ponti]
MKPFWKKVTAFSVMSTMACFVALPAVTSTAATEVTVQQAGNPQGASVMGNLPGDTPVTVDVVMKVKNKDKLAAFIQDTTTPGSRNYRKYLSVDAFRKAYGADAESVRQVVEYLRAFGIQTTVAPNNLIVTANGTAAQFNKAFSVTLKKEEYKGEHFHGSKENPKVPAHLGNNILCILGLSNYSSYTSHAVKQTPLLENGAVPQGPLSLTPQDLIQHYNVQPLYDKGAAGAGQTIGIVTLADFNQEDAYAFWKQAGISVKPNRITKVNVDGGSGWDGYDETTLDVEQSGALAPQADIRVFVGPNSDTGFVDTFSTAINENKSQQISVSWGESETAVNYLVQLQQETPKYAEVFNQLFMQAASQGISMFAASGDEGAYDAAREFGLSSGIAGATSLSVDTPADSPYITAAGGTTLPFSLHSDKYQIDITNSAERAWGWDYLYPYFDARGLNNPDGWGSRYLAGGGGGFSQLFATPEYQRNVPGVNQYTAVKQWTENADQSSLTRDTAPTIVTGKGKGRNLPDLSMNADPYTGYKVWVSDPGAPGTNAGYATYGGTSFVSPQLCGLSALMNSANGTQAGFWNTQLYRFALQKDSPLHPLNTTGPQNDNGFYTGTPGTVYNQATGLGTPDIAALARKFNRR